MAKANHTQTTIGKVGAILRAIPPNVATMLWGGPGEGKTGIVMSVFEKDHNIWPILAGCSDPTDMGGIPDKMVDAPAFEHFPPLWAFVASTIYPEWYKAHGVLRWPVRWFWWVSDYGSSTGRIVGTFFTLALVFAAVYYASGFIDYYFLGTKDYPGVVSNLFVLEGKQEVVSCWLVPFRAAYFSIVTMTTLGFADMNASAYSFLRGLFGHMLLAVQVILGYVLLGALVTRFAVLFTAGGPAGEFADEKDDKEAKRWG